MIDNYSVVWSYIQISSNLDNFQKNGNNLATIKVYEFVFWFFIHGFTILDSLIGKLRNKVQLLAYPDHIGNDLGDLLGFMNQYLSKAIGGVHILPFYPSNADGGFSPLTHLKVDPNFGTWRDIEKIAQKYDLCADITLNHISDESDEFIDFVEKGYQSKFADLFVHVNKFGSFTHDDLAKIHIRKEKEPFREVQFKNGKTAQVWSTFTEHQIDLNYESPKTFALMKKYMQFLAQKGVKLFRLDAFGYITKKRGTSCFLLEPEIYKHLEWFRKTSDQYGTAILPEVHDHPSFQHAISQRGAYSYGFALPPLVLYSILDCNTKYLKDWLRVCPDNQITVLDTHDGICIPDVEGILPDDKIDLLIHDLSTRSADPILRRSAANIHSVGAIYQVTCTFYDALKQNDNAYIIARAIQLFTPGIPQVYYVGLLAEKNNIELMEETGHVRAINRHFFSLDEVKTHFKKKIVKRLVRLMEFRSQYPAFQGTFELHSSNNSSLIVTWRKSKYFCTLSIDFNFRKGVITYFDQISKKVKKITI